MIRRKATAKKGRKIGAAGDYAKFELAVIKALAKLLKKPYKKVIEAVNLDENLLNIISKSFDQKLSVKETAQKLKSELIKVAQKTPLEAFVQVLNRLPKKETTGKFSFPIKLPAAVTIGKVEQHRDYKSHNVKINVLSGINKEDVIAEIKDLEEAIESYTDFIRKNTAELKRPIYRGRENSYMRDAKRISIKETRKLLTIAKETKKHLMKVLKIYL